MKNVSFIFAFLFAASEIHAGQKVVDKIYDKPWSSKTMNFQPEWKPQAALESIRNWTQYLHVEAKRLLIQDETHASMLFLFNRESGLVSVSLVPPNIDGDQLSRAIVNAIHEHDLYGVVLISEAWSYNIKKNDHIAFQILNGEMKVSDLSDEYKKEQLLVIMENRDGDRLTYSNEMIRDKNGVSLNKDHVSNESDPKWFSLQEKTLESIDSKR